MNENQPVLEPSTSKSPVSSRKRTFGRLLLLCLILGIALCWRVFELGRLSFWYDEVVTIRLAETAGPRRLIELLNTIDATRAAVHPLILQQWIKLWGDSEASARSLSVVFGLLTVVAVYRLAWTYFQDRTTALWGAFLAANSPLLVVYSREVRMYAWLVLITCLAWDAMFRLSPRVSRSVHLLNFVYFGLLLIVLVASHPLGLLMLASLVLSTVLLSVRLEINRRRLLMTYLVVGMAVKPFLSAYLDHEPESTVGRLPIRFLLGTPIGFVGGNFLTLLVLLLWVVYGLLRGSKAAPKTTDSAVLGSANLALSCWLLVAPVVLYLYSRIGSPIFGPARYTLFVAPAFLLLLARGLSLSRRPFQIIGMVLILSLTAASNLKYLAEDDAKADWRSASRFLKTTDPEEKRPLIVVATGGGPNVEVETARYYVGTSRRIVPFDPKAPLARVEENPSFFAVGHRGNRAATPLPPAIRSSSKVVDFPGLRLYDLTKRTPATLPSS